MYHLSFSKVLLQPNYFHYLFIFTYSFKQYVDPDPLAIKTVRKTFITVVL
jgi:hypothetical protein